jgi:uncharacterized protein (TIGR03435 family)
MVPARSDCKLGPKVEDWDSICGGRTPPEDDDPKTPVARRLSAAGDVLEGVTMFAVAEMFSIQRQALGRIVEDRTGLTGRYKMELEFQLTLRALANRQPETDPMAAPNNIGPSIFTAVREQRGTAPKGSLEVLVVDSAQR